MLELLKEDSTKEEKVTEEQASSFTEDIARVAEWGVMGAALGGRYGAGCTSGAAAGSWGGAIGMAGGCAMGVVTVFVLSGATKKLAQVGINLAKKNAGKVLQKLEPIMIKGKKLFDDVEVIVKEVPRSVFLNPNLYKGLTVAGNLGFGDYDAESTPDKKEETDINVSPGYKFLGVQATDNFSIDPIKEKNKAIIPPSGVVVPRVKIYYPGENDKGETKAFDLTLYLNRLISISWVDAENGETVPNVNITCAYHPDIIKLDTSVWVLFFVGTQDGELLNLGTFHLKQVGKTFSHGSYVCNLLFTAVSYKSAKAQTLMPKNQCVKVETYQERLDAIAQQLKYKTETKGVEQKLNQEFVLNIDLDTNTPYYILSHMARTLELDFTVRNNTIILREKASDKNRVNYLIPLSAASNFDIQYELNINYDLAQVVSSTLTKDKQPIIGKAKAKLRHGEGSSGAIMTKHVDVKTQEEANKAAKVLLNQVNSLVTSCSLTVPNCLLFAGNNVIINQTLPGYPPEPPIKLRIQQASHEISASRWAVTLQLAAIATDEPTAEKEQSDKIKELVKKMDENIKEFESNAMDRGALKSILNSFSSGLKIPKADQYALLYASSISKHSYPVTGGATAVNLAKARKKFLETSVEIDQELGKLGSSLLTENKKPNAIVEQAFHTFNLVAMGYYGVSGTVEEKENKDDKKDQ